MRVVAFLVGEHDGAGPAAQRDALLGDPADAFQRRHRADRAVERAAAGHGVEMGAAPDCGGGRVAARVRRACCRCRPA